MVYRKRIVGTVAYNKLRLVYVQIVIQNGHLCHIIRPA